MPTTSNSIPTANRTTCYSLPGSVVVSSEQRTIWNFSFPVTYRNNFMNNKLSDKAYLGPTFQQKACIVLSLFFLSSKPELLREAAMGKERFLVRDLKISHKRCWIFKSFAFSRYGVWLNYAEWKLYSFGLLYKSAVLIYYATRVWEHAVTETHWCLYAAWISICRVHYATLLTTRDRSCNWMKHAQNHGQYHLVRDARCYPTLPADDRYCLNLFAWSSATTRNNLIIETSHRWACDVSKLHPIRDDVSYWSSPIGTGFLMTSTNNMFYRKS
jgi:hypothetical protein